MQANSTNILTREACRESLLRFWSEQLRVSDSGKELQVTLPLSYPDGLQVVISLQQVTQTDAILSDKGEVIGTLEGSGIKMNLERNAELLEQKLKIFELQRSGFELQKTVRLPLDGLDIHLFGEALVSISHLLYHIP